MACGRRGLARQRRDTSRAFSWSAYARIQHCSGVDEAEQSDGDDQRGSDNHYNRDLYSADRFLARDDQSTGSD